MKFQLAVNLERMDNSIEMEDVKNHTLDMVQMADQGGFNIVWAAEHHAIEMTIAPNPFQILTWWANHTDKIRLGTAVVNAAYWHPINLAGEAAFTDLISGGRLEFGIGSSFHPFTPFPAPPTAVSSSSYQDKFDCCHKNARTPCPFCRGALST